MRSIFLFAAAFIFASATAFSQNQFETLADPHGGGKMLKGVISRDQLERDTAFSWYAGNKGGYTPNPGALEGLRKNADSLELVVFMGTWCDDSHFVIPKFFSLVDASGFPKDHISLIAVDRNKKTVSHLAEAWNIINVPTIIVMKNGKELGRVVEYGKTGVFDRDLAQVINPAVTAP